MAQHFPDRDLMARMTARMLLELGAVRFATDRPFMFTSGLASPVYVDMRRVISFPRARRKIVEMASSTLLQDLGYESIDAVAGGETAGIPYAAWISDAMMLPMPVASPANSVNPKAIQTSRILKTST